MTASCGPFFNSILPAGYTDAQLEQVMAQVAVQCFIEEPIVELVGFRDEIRALRVGINAESQSTGDMADWQADVEWVALDDVTPAIKAVQTMGASAPYSMFEAFEDMHVLLPNVSEAGECTITVPWEPDYEIPLHFQRYDDAIEEIEEYLAEYGEPDCDIDAEELEFTVEILDGIKACQAAGVCFIFSW